MPMVPGTGKLQQAILAQLDGLPVDFADLVAGLAGPAPTQSQYTAIHAAVHSLARGRFVELAYRPRGTAGPPLLRVVKVEPPPVHVRSSDRACAAEDQAAPVTPAEWYQGLADEAWAAFGTDPGYGVAIARAAVKLLEAEGTPVGVLVSDDDSGEGTSPDIAQVRPR